MAALRAAGLVVLGSTNLSEWANMRSPHSASGWSAVGGLTGNPWALDRSAGGSSSGSGAALAAGLAPLAIGTETDGSITCPSSLNGVVGLKPTVGLLPTEGVVPLAASQDAPGPMARSVRDVALLLDALTGSTAYSSAPGTRPLASLTLGVADGWRSGHDATEALFDSVLGRLADAGATVGAVVVEPAGTAGRQELDVLLCELKDGLDRYLAARPGDGVRSLADVIAFDEEHADLELAHFGHEFLVQAEATGGVDDPVYAESRAGCLRWAVEEMLEPAFGGDLAPDLLDRPGVRAGVEERPRVRRPLRRRREREHGAVARRLAGALPADGARRGAPRRSRAHRAPAGPRRCCSPRATRSRRSSASSARSSPPGRPRVGADSGHRRGLSPRRVGGVGEDDGVTDRRLDLARRRGPARRHRPRRHAAA